MGKDTATGTQPWELLSFNVREALTRTISGERQGRGWDQIMWGLPSQAGFHQENDMIRPQTGLPSMWTVEGLGGRGAGVAGGSLVRQPLQPSGSHLRLDGHQSNQPSWFTQGRGSSQDSRLSALKQENPGHRDKLAPLLATKTDISAT